MQPCCLVFLLAGMQFCIFFYHFYQVVYVLMEGGWESLPCSPVSGAGLHRQLDFEGGLQIQIHLEFNS